MLVSPSGRGCALSSGGCSPLTRLQGRVAGTRVRGTRASCARDGPSPRPGAEPSARGVRAPCARRHHSPRCNPEAQVHPEHSQHHTWRWPRP